jgi:glycine betaine/proline transport system ATP-binding protein
MQDELINLQQVMHKTIIFITHDFLEAVKLGDYIAIMWEGEIVQVGTPDQIIMNPINDYVAEFTKDVPRSRVLTAGSIMTECKAVVSENASPQECVSLMQSLDCSLAFVRNESGRYAGICYLEQASQAVTSNSQNIKALVSNHQPTVSPHTVLADLIPLTAANEDPVPVVNQSQELVGTIDRTGVILAFGGDGEAS